MAKSPNKGTEKKVLKSWSRAESMERTAKLLEEKAERREAAATKLEMAAMKQLKKDAGGK